jgi:hypothetical protein
MLIESVPIGSLLPDPANVRKHGDKFRGTGKNKQRLATCSVCRTDRWVRADSKSENCKSCTARISGQKAIRVKTGKFHPCLKCGNEFWQYRHLDGKQRFCSHLCASDFKRKYEKSTRSCANCQGDFTANDRPFSNSTGKYCSRNCKIADQTTGVNIIFKPTKAAANAGYAIRAAVKRRQIEKPTCCENCGVSNRPIQAAHYNYVEKLRVRWLCRPCHAAWDYSDPKGGAVRIDLRSANAS